MSYKITRLARQIMEIKDGEKHKKKKMQPKNKPTQANKKTQLLDSPLPLLAILLRVIFETFF